MPASVTAPDPASVSTPAASPGAPAGDLPVSPSGEHRRAHGQGRPCVITRRATFSASHRYWLPELSAEENQACFGACSLAPGHGHNYELIVAMGGGLDPDGMVLNLSEVKHAIRSQVTAQLDYRCLNEVWPEFDVSRPEGRLPTTEALGQAIWTRLAPLLPLVGLRLYEQPTLWVDLLPPPTALASAPASSPHAALSSPAPMEAFLSIRTHFAAAHRLARPELSQSENEAIYGKCARPHGHGHNYLLDVTVRGPIDPRTGMVCDLAVLQRLVDDLVVEPFDHTFLNKDVEHFATTVPTAENIALHIADLLTGPIAASGARLHKVRLQESPNNAAEVFAEVPQLEMRPAALEALAAV
ncbi:6-carboxytetrahydropterin synthase [Cyanobium sp. CH-040]|uniref:6-pyruvoyl trahydropterin synthase family protein n=1 Tax=Cyanobium sp. CH-040 TaxID=2823708 RepID=UPI0021BC7D28|nr:6-carboxytetrahydropterin synthase [Cyanobium sp. CH-040]MCP9928992.1 6-carboxytetrahydropterin synthase [Cyanobium sp. CH-040]